MEGAWAGLALPEHPLPLPAPITVQQRNVCCAAHCFAYWKEVMTSYAEFDIAPARRFIPQFFGPDTLSATPYDEQAHRYRTAYVHPQSWTITLDAVRGLRASLPNALAVKARRSEPPIATNSQEFLEAVLARPEPADVDDGPALRVPENFIAYEWTVVELGGGDFFYHRVIGLPTYPTWLAHVELPREGRYRISCRATFTDRPPDEVTVQYVLRDFLIASIGESLAAGQGNPDHPGSARSLFPGPDGFSSQCDATTLSARLRKGVDLGDFGSHGLPIVMQRDPIWLEPKASRSLMSGHALAAGALQRRAQLEDGTIVDDLITFVSFARSGAEIFDGFLGPQGGDDDFIGVGQTEEMRRTVDGRAIDALLISVGGNDAGFSGVLTDLFAKDFSIWRIGSDADGRAEVVKRVERRLGIGLPPDDRGEVEIAFDALGNELDTLRRQLPIGDIYITTYPTSLFERRGTRGQVEIKTCELFSGPDLDITNADVRVLQRMGGLLNDLIRRKAREFNWHLIDIDATGEFSGRGYCAPKRDRCWVRAEESCDRQGNFDGTMHPNRRGHAIYGFHIADALSRITLSRYPITPLPMWLEPVLGVVMTSTAPELSVSIAPVA